MKTPSFVLFFYLLINNINGNFSPTNFMPENYI